MAEKPMESVKVDRSAIMVREEDREQESELSHSSNGLIQVVS